MNLTKTKSLLLGFLVMFLILGTGVGASAQPTFVPASGCQSAAVTTTEQVFNPATGGFTQDRTIAPGDTNVVIGAFVFADDQVADPTGGAGTVNCPAGGDDANRLYVTKAIVKPISGDPVALGVQDVTFWLDNNRDGFLNAGLDTQLATLPGSCLSAAGGCVLTFGNQPIFNDPAAVGNGLTDKAVGVVVAANFPASAQALLVSVNIGTPQPAATLQVSATGQASDIVNNPVGAQFSTNFSPNHTTVASNTRAVVEGVPPPGAGGAILSNAVNNGSGNPETGIEAVNVDGIRTRDDRGTFSGTTARDARPSDREYFVGLATLCEASVPVNDRVVILPPIASATPTIAGFLASLPCVPTGAAAVVDGLVTNVVRIRIGVTGPGAQYVQAIRAYADLDAAAGSGWPAGAGVTLAGQLFETGELIFSQIPVGGVAQIGSLQQTLTTSGGTALLLAAGVAGVAPPPGPLYFTADISNDAKQSEVTFEVAIDVADIIGTPSSRLITTLPMQWKFTITGPPAGPGPGQQCPPGQIGTPPNCTTPPPAQKKGDVDGDGDVDRLDARLVTNFLRGRATLSDAAKAAADVSAPCGTVDRVDARTITLMARGRASASCTSAFAAATVQTLSLSNVSVTSGAQGLQFALSGSGIQQAQVQVLDLSGGMVYDSGMSSPYALSWNLLDASGSRVANGVYLYVVRVVGANGQLVSKVSKLAIVK